MSGTEHCNCLGAHLRNSVRDRERICRRCGRPNALLDNAVQGDGYFSDGEENEGRTDRGIFDHPYDEFVANDRQRSQSFINLEQRLYRTELQQDLPAERVAVFEDLRRFAREQNLDYDEGRPQIEQEEDSEGEEVVERTT